MNSLSFTITGLVSNFSGHRGTYKPLNDKFEIEAKYINIEKGLYAVHAQIKVSETQKIIQLADDNKDWNTLYLFNRDVCIDDILYPSSLFVGFNDKNYTLTIEPNQEINIFILLIHKSYIKQYEYVDCFRRIRKSKRNIYSIPNNKLSHLPSFTPENAMGLVRTKFFAISLLSGLRAEVEKVKNKLKVHILDYCSECLDKNQDIHSFLSQKLTIEPRYLMLLFSELFKQDINSYYQEFKIVNAKLFIRNQKDQLDQFIKECLKGPCPVAILLAIKFELSTEKYRRLFLEETGESVSKYCEKLKLKEARQLLLDGLKTRKVANTIGFANPITLSRFFQKREGLSPQQFRTKNTKANSY